MQGGLVRRKLYVCLSVNRVQCDKTEEKPAQFSEQWRMGGDLFYLKFWVDRPPFERNR